MTTLSLNSEIIAYLTVNNIPFTSLDYQTGIPSGSQTDQILYWNTEVLGPEPTQEQLDDAWPIYEGQQIAVQNKAAASQLLTDTDWTSIPAVADPLRSNPYLANQGEFDSYRSQVREIAVNPPTTPAVFPAAPVADWQTAPSA